MVRVVKALDIIIIFSRVTNRASHIKWIRVTWVEYVENGRWINSWNWGMKMGRFYGAGQFRNRSSQLLPIKENPTFRRSAQILLVNVSSLSGRGEAVVGAVKHRHRNRHYWPCGISRYCVRKVLDIVMVVTSTSQPEGKGSKRFDVIEYLFLFVECLSAEERSSWTSLSHSLLLMRKL